MIDKHFRNYFAAFTGSATWDDLKPHFDLVFHEDLIVKTANGEIDRDGWEMAVKGLLASGSKGKIDSIRFDGETLFYAGTISLDDGSTMRPLSKGTVKDGKLILVEPMNPMEYTSIAGSNSPL